MTTHHLAQFNIATLLAPIDSPQLAMFVARLDEINTLAEQAEGFVWRYVAPDSNDATAVRPIGDDVIVNLTVWASIEALHQYTYYSDHVDLFRQRAAWFEKPTKSPFVLWWIEAGHIPTLTEGIERLEYLHEQGASAAAFTFKERFLP